MCSITNPNVIVYSMVVMTDKESSIYEIVGIVNGKAEKITPSGSEWWDSNKREEYRHKTEKDAITFAEKVASRGFYSSVYVVKTSSKVIKRFDNV